jgi:Flp pilus assembly protein TadB
MKFPAWLLALAFVTAVVAVVVLITQGHEEDVWQVLELVVPVLAALFVLNRVDARSDTQDQQLETNHAVMAQVHDQVNGNLTRRLDDAVAPVREQLEQLHALIRDNHPDDPRPDQPSIE